MTDAEMNALYWLSKHNSDGIFSKGGKGNYLIAGGEVGPFTRSTWNHLQERGFVEYYGGKTSRARCRISSSGSAILLTLGNRDRQLANIPTND